MLDKKEIQGQFAQKMTACALYGVNKECYEGLLCPMAGMKGICVLGVEIFGKRACLFREDIETGEIYKKGKKPHAD